MRAILRRLTQLVVVVVVVTFFTAALTSLLPGDPAEVIAPFATEAQRDEIRKANNLDEPLVVRYGEWLKGFFTGDMGEEYAGAGVRGEAVWERAQNALPKSLALMFYSQLLTLAIALPLGVVTAYRAGSRLDRYANGFAFALVALPTFVLAALLQLYVAVEWGLGDLPATGWVDPGAGLSDHLRSVALPVLAIAVGQIAVYARLLRSDMVATLQEDFILMAKSKGLRDRRILWRHALRPSSLTLLTVAGLNVGTLIGGALVVERIFDISGMGFLIYDAIARRQYIALQSYIAIVAILYVLVNFVVDILYTVLDPRIRGVRVA